VAPLKARPDRVNKITNNSGKNKFNEFIHIDKFGEVSN
jgi:hypothetical protein